MRKMKSILALVLSCLLMLSSVGIVSAADEIIEWKAGWDATNDADKIHYDLRGLPISNLGADYGSTLDIVGNIPVDYTITTQQTGFYTLELSMGCDSERTFDISIDGEKMLSGSVNTGAWGTREWVTAGAVPFTANTPTVLTFQKTSTGAGTLGIVDCRLTYIPPIALVSASIAEGEAAARGTDVITLTYDHDLDAAKLSEAAVTLTNNTASAEVPVTLAVAADNTKQLLVQLGESLAYGAGYTLTAAGVPDTYGYTSESTSISFTASDAAGDTAAENAAVTIDSILEENGTFTITGTMLGSHGLGIAGRGVTATVTAPNAASPADLTPAVSGENGAFTLTYTVEEGAESGAYTFTVGGDYVAAANEDTETKAFVSETEKAEILGALAAAADAATAEAVIAANAALLGVDPTELSVLSDTSLFYDRLARASFTNTQGQLDMNLVEPVWTAALALEKIHQSNSDSVTEAVLADADAVAALGLDMTDYEALATEAQEKIISAITLLPRQEDAAALGALFAEMVADATEGAAAGAPIVGAADSYTTQTNVTSKKESASTWVPAGQIDTGDGASWIYEVTPPVAGNYLLSLFFSTHNRPTTVTVSVGAAEQFAASVQIDNSVRQEYPLGVVSFPSAAKSELRFQGGSVYAKEYKLTYLAPNSFAGLEANGAAVANGGEIARATDVLAVSFTNALSADAIGALAVSLNDAAGGVVSAQVAIDETDDKTLLITLDETLDYSTDYTLSLGAVTDAYGTSAYPLYLDLATGATDATQNSTLALDEVSLSGTTFTVTGTVLGSAGQGLSGRTVSAEVVRPDSAAPVDLGSVTSGENGAFSYTYTLAAGQEANGEYTFTVSGEHAAVPVTGKKRYVSEEKKQEVLGALQDAADAAAAETVISTYQAELGVALADLSVLTDDSLFYERLAVASYTNTAGSYDMDVFDTVWTASLALETINQGDDDTATQAVLEDAESAAALGLDLTVYNDLTTEKAAFITAVTALPSQTDAAAFKAEFDALANASMLTEQGKTDITLTLSNQSIYTGGTADVALNLAAAATDISGYTLAVDCTSADAAGRVALTAPAGAAVTKTVSGSTVTFGVTGLSGASVTSLGTLSYNSSPVETVTLSLGGELAYSVAALSYDITADILPATATVTVSQNPGGTGGNGGASTVNRGGSSGGGYVSLPPATETPVEGTETPTESGEPFDDWNDIAWAADSIKALYHKGVISDSEDRRFRPADNVTRAEFVKMLVEILGIGGQSADISFNDVAEDAWFYTYIADAVHYGLVQGDENNSFNPDAHITRQDICVITSRAMDQLGYTPGEIGELFTDDAAISGYAREAVYRMRTHEIVNGMGDGSFAPRDNANRAMTAKMLEQFMKEAGI